MKIRIETDDIEKLLAHFYPAGKYENGTLQFKIKGKPVSVGNTELELKSKVVCDTISGNLNLNLNQDGVDAEVKLD